MLNFKGKKNFGSAIVVIALAVILCASMSWILYEHTVNLLTVNLRERLLSIVTTAVIQLDPNNINALHVENDWKKPEWKKVVRNLKRIKDNNNDIVFAYIFRKNPDNPTLMEFVADAESMNPYANVDDDPSNDVDANGDGIVEADGADFLQWPGQSYDDPPVETFESYSGSLTSKDLYEDQYGPVLTGYAPIVDDEGNVVAVLAVDIRANDFFTITQQTLYPFLLFITVLILVIIILFTFTVAIWSKRVAMIAELDKQKDELLSMVSHQLATPISAVKWNLEMMLEGDMGKLTKEETDTLTSLQGITANLADLVSMILDVSRIQLGRMKIEKQELDLNTFFEEILNVIKPKAKEKNVEFNVKLPNKLPKATLDKRYTYMTIENLLSNAVKYSGEKGVVNLNVELVGDTLSCIVKDNGMGIPKAEQSKIFGKMYRASNVRNNVDGNGFGLYVAKGAVEAQGGKIWFESEEGKGTTFSVLLPLNKTN